jgi:hypothetical protein
VAGLNGNLHFTPVALGTTNLDGQMQVLEGLKVGDQVVVYSAKALNEHTRIRVVKHLLGVK